MTENQREYIRESMQRYELYLKTKSEVLTLIDVEKVKKVMGELGHSTDVRTNCIECIYEYIRIAYETIWIK